MNFVISRKKTGCNLNEYFFPISECRKKIIHNFEMAIQPINNRITFDNMFLRNKNTTTNYFHDRGYFRPSSSSTIVEINMMMSFFTRARDRINSPKFIEIGEGTLENISSSIVLIYLFIYFSFHRPFDI